jgi:hypothetical protein
MMSRITQRAIEMRIAKMMASTNPPLRLENLGHMSVLVLLLLVPRPGQQLQRRGRLTWELVVAKQATNEPHHPLSIPAY